MKKRKLIKVGLVGFNEKMASSIAYFLKKEHSNAKFQITSKDDKDALVLVDGDSIDGQVYLIDTKSACHKLLVARYKSIRDDGFDCLLKPIIPDELMAKLLDLSNNELQPAVKGNSNQCSQDKNHSLLKRALGSNECKTQTKQKPSNIPVSKPNFYQPNSYLQGILQQCVKKATKENPLVQAYLPFGDVVVDAEKHEVYLMLGHKQIRVYERMPLTESVMLRSMNRQSQLFETKERVDVVDLNDLLWDSSLAASSGRLPEGADINRVVQIKYWPNLTKTRYFDHACQIAALWSQKPLSIRQVVERLKVEYKLVYQFYSAAVATNLIEVADSNVLSIQSKKTTQTKPSILQKLLSRLRNAS